MGFLARVHADGRGSAKAGRPMARLAGQDGDAEAPVPTDPVFSDPILEAGPMRREGVDPFSADPGPFPALGGTEAPGEETMPAARPATEARLSGDAVGWSQALAGAAAGETGPEGKSGRRSLPATRSDATGKKPAADRPVPGPHATDPGAKPAGFHPVTDAVRNRGQMEDGGKKSDRAGTPSAMRTAGFPASLPEAALPARAQEREAGSVDAVSPGSASKGAISAAPRPGSGEDSLDKAPGAVSRTLSRTHPRTQKDSARSSASFDTQGNYSGTRNTEGNLRPQPPQPPQPPPPPQGPRVVIGSLQIRVEAPSPAPAAPQESAAAARSRSYRVEW